MKEQKNWTNQEISDLLKSVSAAYQVKGKQFKAQAYDEAAATIEQANSEIKDYWDEGRLEELPAIGKSIADHLDELFKKGKVKHFEKVLEVFPPAAQEFIKISGIGPKSAVKLAEKLNIKRRQGAVERLKQAAQAGKVRQLEGFAKKSEGEIIEAIKGLKRASQRLLLPFASNLAQEVVDYLKKSKAVKKIDVLGSLRRRAATIGDVDLAVASQDPGAVIGHFKDYPKKTKLVESGEKKARLVVSGEYQVDLMIESPESYGSLLQHFTGSKKHNIHLREIAQKKGLSLSEHGIKVLKEKTLKKFSSEKDFYSFLGMAWIPPELREDWGEIEAAEKNQLPELVKLEDLKGDLQLHSSFDLQPSHDLGQDSMEKMVEKAEELGYEYLAFTEHNPSFSQHTDKEIFNIISKKKDKIEQLNSSRGRKVFVFNSLEIDIKPNGEIACPTKALDLLDFALVAVHSSFRMSKNKMTERILRALDHDKVKILAHPTGRILRQREGYEVDWDKVFKFCRQNNKFLEINAYPDRLDLPDHLVKRAIAAGVKLSMGSDSHQLSQMEKFGYAVDVARRGWAEKADIINSLGYNGIKKILVG